jgi:hypothetical protein
MEEESDRLASYISLLAQPRGTTKHCTTTHHHCTTSPTSLCDPSVDVCVQVLTHSPSYPPPLLAYISAPSLSGPPGNSHTTFSQAHCHQLPKWPRQLLSNSRLGPV